MDLETKKLPGGPPKEQQQKQQKQQQQLLHRAPVVREDLLVATSKKYDGSIITELGNAAPTANETADDGGNVVVSPIHKKILNKDLRSFCSDPQGGYWLIGARDNRKRKRSPKAEAQLEMAMELASRKKERKKKKNSNSNETIKSKAKARVKKNRKQDETFGAGKACEQLKRTKTIDANANANANTKDSEKRPLAGVWAPQNEPAPCDHNTAATTKALDGTAVPQKSKPKTPPTNKGFRQISSQQQPKKRGRPRKHSPRTSAKQPPQRGKRSVDTVALSPRKLGLFLDAVRRAKDLLVAERGHDYRNNDHDEDLVILV